MSFLQGLEKSIDYCFGTIPRSRPTPDAIEAVKIIAHRGAHSHRLGIIENTHQAFMRARDLGCWGIELDIHFTADKIPVVNHDPTLLRLWGKDSAIAALTFDELRQVAPFVPSLEEVVSRYGPHMHLFIEIKEDIKEEPILKEILAQLQPTKDYHLLSLFADFFASLQHFPRETLLLVAGHNNVASFCNTSLKEQYGGVLGHYLLFTKRRIQALERAQQKTGVGFVDSKYSLYREINRGLHWLFSNNAGEIMSVMNRLQS